MNTEIRDIFINVTAGMIRNSPTLLKNIQEKTNYVYKEMSKSDLDKCIEELLPYWEHMAQKIQDGSLFNMKAQE